MECKRCGACCKVFNFVELSTVDKGRIPLSMTESYPSEPWTRVMRRKDGSCYCIDIVDGKATCQIYDIRPTVCHGFEPGCDLCIGTQERVKNLFPDDVMVASQTLNLFA